MVLTLSQIVKVEKSFKGKSIAEIAYSFRIFTSFSPQKTENEQSLQRCSTKGMDVCTSIVLSDYTFIHVTGDTLYS